MLIFISRKWGTIQGVREPVFFGCILWARFSTWHFTWVFLYLNLQWHLWSKCYSRSFARVGTEAQGNDVTRPRSHDCQSVGLSLRASSLQISEGSSGGVPCVVLGTGYWALRRNDPCSTVPALKDSVCQRWALPAPQESLEARRL